MCSDREEEQFREEDEEDEGDFTDEEDYEEFEELVRPSVILPEALEPADMASLQELDEDDALLDSYVPQGQLEPGRTLADLIMEKIGQQEQQTKGKEPGASSSVAPARGSGCADPAPFRLQRCRVSRLPASTRRSSTCTRSAFPCCPTRGAGGHGSQALAQQGWPAAQPLQERPAP